MGSLIQRNFRSTLKRWTATRLNLPDFSLKACTRTFTRRDFLRRDLPPFFFRLDLEFFPLLLFFPSSFWTSPFWPLTSEVLPFVRLSGLTFALCFRLEYCFERSLRMRVTRLMTADFFLWLLTRNRSWSAIRFFLSGTGGRGGELWCVYSQYESKWKQLLLVL